jgi:hypothetical protein
VNLADAVVDRVVEGADVDLEIVAGVDHHHRLAVVVDAGVEPALERLGVDKRRAAFLRLDQRHAHGDDFFFDLDQHALVRLLDRIAFLHFQVGEAGVAADPGQVLVDLRARPGQEHIDPFRRQQDGALQVEALADVLVQRTHLFGVVEGDEFVGGDVDVSGSGGGDGGGMRFSL